jgi:hypothetical protein
MRYPVKRHIRVEAAQAPRDQQRSAHQQTELDVRRNAY